MRDRQHWFLLGLLLTTLATLTLEVLSTRLLSVLTWYHLSFFAVSTAMFGMAAGSVRVYLAKDEFAGDAAPKALARYATLLAISIPASHVVNLCIPIPPGTGMPTIVGTAVTSVVLAIPFYVAGITVAIALTRIPGPSGLVYGIDLLGAALAQGLRYWAIHSLGPFWNVRVIVVPGAPAITGGPYRFLRHPNYLAVIAEGIAVPLIHTAWLTAILFTLANAVVLAVRIRCEEGARARHCAYRERLGDRPRFVPSRLFGDAA